MVFDEMCEINAYHDCTSHLEELYLQNQELKERIEALERELELSNKNMLWNKMNAYG
jgi:cell shape-determining protein MreC